MVSFVFNYAFVENIYDNFLEQSNFLFKGQNDEDNVPHLLLEFKCFLVDQKSDKHIAVSLFKDHFLLFEIHFVSLS